MKCGKEVKPWPVCDEPSFSYPGLAVTLLSFLFMKGAQNLRACPDLGEK
jgi:hypothetical protein